MEYKEDKLDAFIELSWNDSVKFVIIPSTAYHYPHRFGFSNGQFKIFLFNILQFKAKKNYSQNFIINFPLVISQCEKEGYIVDLNRSTTECVQAISLVERWQNLLVPHSFSVQ